MEDTFDIAVVGAGVVGCAVAMALSRQGRGVIVLEAEAKVGQGVTSRNSGVIHSGIYYPPASLKAASCVRGNSLLYQWANEHGVWHAKTGKLIVARKGGEGDLERLLHNAQASGARGLRMIAGSQVAEVGASKALLCEETGIVDAFELTLSLKASAEAQGATFVQRAQVSGIDASRAGYVLSTNRGEVVAERVVNAAGLHADEVAAMAGVTRYTIHPCRGDYFRLRSPVAYRRLIYPVKDKTNPGLGIHLTLERGGGYRLGPDAEYVARKDDFAGGEHKLALFHAAAERLLGPLDPAQLTHDGCGIRPKLRGPGDAEERDFVLAEDLPGFVNLVGIESPGLTAALDLAERVATLVGGD